MNVRRLPGFIYNYKLATVLLVSGLFLIVYLLLYWGVMCTNLEAWRHVSIVVSSPRANRSDRCARITELQDPRATARETGVYKYVGLVKVCKGVNPAPARSWGSARDGRTRVLLHAASGKSRDRWTRAANSYTCKVTVRYIRVFLTDGKSSENRRKFSRLALFSLWLKLVGRGRSLPAGGQEVRDSKID